jgi:hypothetical protein
MLQYKEKIVSQYFIKKGKTYPIESSDFYEETFSFNIPEVLTDDFFFRHQLTLCDYEKILSGSKKISYLWALALAKQVTITPTSVNSCFMRNVSSRLGGSNKHVVSKLLEKMQSKIQSSEYAQTILQWKNKIVCPHDKSVPPMPVHFVSSEHLASYPAPSRSYPHGWSFQLNPRMPPIACVPLMYYHGYLMMIRIETKTSYEERFGVPKSLAELPPEFVIQTHVYYGIEEAFLLQTPEAHEQLCNQTEDVLLALDEQTLWQQSVLSCHSSKNPSESMETE